jgi:ParB/RepB/Spo0J family partition protein
MKTAIAEPLQQVQHFETTLLQEAAWNARKTFDRASLDELIGSIEQHGIQVPLLVRNIEDDYYEVVCGHRRLKAASLAGLKTVPCIVRVLSDEQAQEIGLIDNLQRVDVPPMEEAEAFNQLLPRLGSIAAVAAKVGKEQAYIAKRLRLCALTTWSCEALNQQLITIDHALLLARLAADEQNAALKWTLDHTAGSKKPLDKVISEIVGRRKDRAEKLAEDPEEYSYYRHHSFEPQSVVRLKSHIAEDAGTVLARAPWNLDDIGTILDPGVLSCNACPKNTKANAPLFGDLEIGEPTCTDGQCFQSKTAAFVQIKQRELGHDETAKQKNLIPRLSWKQSSVKPGTSFNDIGGTGAMTMTANPAKIIKAGAWVEAKKGSCANVRPGVTADWSDANDRGYMGDSKKLRKPGEILQVCIAVGCKVHRKEYEKPKSENRNVPHDVKAEEEKREKTRLAALAETKLRVRIAGEAIERVKSLPLDSLRHLLIGQLPSGGELQAFNAILPGVEKILRSAKLDSVEFARAVALVSIEGRHVEVFEYWKPEQFRREFIADLQRWGYDASKAWEKPAAPKVQPKTAKGAAKTAPKKLAKTAKKKAVRK